MYVFCRYQPGVQGHYHVHQQTPECFEPKALADPFQRWYGTEAWRIAKQAHDAICKRGHQMDQCWGLELPYDLLQPNLSSTQRDYLSRAIALLRIAGTAEATAQIFDVLGANWRTPERID